MHQLLLLHRIEKTKNNFGILLAYSFENEKKTSFPFAFCSLNRTFAPTFHT